MARKAIYEPGELESTKKRLGKIDIKEARRMQKILGGEIGEERSETTAVKQESGRSGASAPASKPKRIIEIAPEAGSEKSESTGIHKFQRQDSISYIERVKMDACCGSRDYSIKTPWQVFVSRICFFKTPLDKVNPWFVKTLLNEYYEKLECVVTSTRLVFPRNNSDLSKQVRTTSKTAFKILNTLRQWKLDVVISEISKIQSRPRNVFVKDFETLLRRIYSPIYILGKLDIERDIRASFSVLYDIAVKENFKDRKMLQNKIAEAVHACHFVCRDLHRLLYPLLMKTIATYYQDYDLFFYENAENYKAFLGLSEADQIVPDTIKNEIAGKDSDEEGQDGEAEESLEDSLSDIDGNTGNNSEKKAAESEVKAICRGMKILETLFPKAPWDKMSNFPDFYPYFADVVEIKKNGELIAPEDPIQIALILSQIIEELLYGFRYIKFNDGLNSGDFLNSIVDNWHTAILESFEKNYIPRIAEYAHYFEHSGQNRSSTYAVNIASDIHWLRRYYFLPNYTTLPPTPPSFLKKDVIALYPLAHSLRKDLSGCASAIESANRAGGSVNKTEVPGIINPWDDYNFEVDNPLSKRLNMLLGKSQRNNTSLIFFTLAIVTVLDNYLCGKDSTAYSANNEILFRHVEQEEMKPVFWVEKKKGTFEIFKKSIDELKKKKS
ncbi:MAG: hypothetical protein LBH18_04150 [Spirochaetaceae bacterium]|jgi:hypothetical protein|nr:hypothetical protein [Spirochaetaceae bacterium]